MLSSDFYLLTSVIHITFIGVNCQFLNYIELNVIQGMMTKNFNYVILHIRYYVND